MPYVKFRHFTPTPDVARVIDQANEIIAELAAEGYILTLRQLYYQFIGRGWLPENTEQQYKRLGRIVTDARVGGLMDWDAIEDRGRQCWFNSYNADPLKLLDRIERGLGVDPWDDQDVYLENWIEKQSLEPVLGRPCQKWRAPYMACKGYLSASEAYRAGLRFERAIARGKRPVLIHLGDHDPSGQDMTRDNGERLELFARQGVEVVRVALNMDQIQQYKPPPMPSKTSDSREKAYRKKHGEHSWELDALQPRVITGLIEEAIQGFIDMDKWEESMEREREVRRQSGLHLFRERYEELRQLALSPEKPLERLARLDGALPRLLSKVKEVHERRLEPPVLVSREMREQAATVAKAVLEGTKASTDEVTKAILDVADAPLPSLHDMLSHEMVRAREDLLEADVPTPFEGHVEVTNDLVVEDPDEEEQDMGMGPYHAGDGGDDD